LKYLKNHYLALANEIYNNIKSAAETMSESINIVIRLMPSGDELDVELPVFTTGKELVGQLLGENLAPRTDPEGNPYGQQRAPRRRKNALRRGHSRRRNALFRAETRGWLNANFFPFNL
jgi:hypothetical protein